MRRCRSSEESYVPQSRRSARLFDHLRNLGGKSARVGKKTCPSSASSHRCARPFVRAHVRPRLRIRAHVRTCVRTYARAYVRTYVRTICFPYVRTVSTYVRTYTRTYYLLSLYTYVRT